MPLNLLFANYESPFHNTCIRNIGCLVFKKSAKNWGKREKFITDIPKVDFWQQQLTISSWSTVSLASIIYTSLQSHTHWIKCLQRNLQLQPRSSLNNFPNNWLIINWVNQINAPHLPEALQHTSCRCLKCLNLCLTAQTYITGRNTHADTDSCGWSVEIL